MKGLFVLSLVAIAITFVASASPAATIDQLLGQYLLIHKSLASDSTNGVAAAAARIAKISGQSANVEPQAKAQLSALADAASKFPTADLKSARNGFGDLSDRMIAYLQAVQAKRNPPYQYYCSMVKKHWLQPDSGTRNPYYGSSMLTCGELVQSGQPSNPLNGNHHH